MQDIFRQAQELMALYGLNIIASIIILIVGRWLAKFISKMLEMLMSKHNVDPTLKSFVCHLTYVALLAFVIIAALGKLGIQTASFVAVLGAAGLAIGLALQGSLSNFAAGVLMIIFKPFKVGDYIEGAGTAGIVEEIQIFTTTLKTPDNKTIIIPNAKISSDNIVNFSTKPTRRVDMVFGVSYSDDIDKVKSVISEVIAKDERILQDPAPQVALSALADNSVNFVVRPWAKSADHWPVYFDTHEAIKKRFDEEGISIPFPQRDVHLYRHETGE
jgi:small conductance mechanosensitive channel